MSISGILQKLHQCICDHPSYFVFGLAVFVRIILLSFFPIPDQSGGDFGTYSVLAQSVIAGNGLSNIQYLAPGFVFFLVLTYVLFGVSPYSVVIMQIVLSGLLAVGVQRLGVLLLNQQVGLYAGVLVSLWPPFIIQTFGYGSSLLLYTTILLFAVYWYIYAWRNRHLGAAIISGILLGLGALTDSIALYIPFVVFVWSLIIVVTHILRRKKLSFVSRHIIVFLFFISTFVSVLTPWVYRNTQVFADYPVAPLIVKDIEREIFTLKMLNLVVYPFSPGGLHIFSAGLVKEFLVPFNLSQLDHSETLSYKKIIFDKGQERELTRRQSIILLSKIIFTVFHLSAIFLSTLVVLFREIRKEYVFIWFLIVYTVVTSIIVGSLAGDHFQSIAPLNSFLFPLMPFILFLASVTFVRLYEQKKSFL